jgi:cytochrome P450
MPSPVNLMSPEFRSNPYPVYAELLERTPVCQVEPMGLWAVTRYEDCLTVLKDPQRFSSEVYGSTIPSFLSDVPIGQAILGKSMVSIDPPYHTKLRSLVSRAFGGPSMSRMEARIRVIAEELAANVARQSEVEFVSEFALPLPAFVIGDLLGLDRSLHTHFKRWTDDVVSAMTGVHTPETAGRIRESFREMGRYLKEVLDERRRAPQDDMASELLRAEVDGKALDEQEVLSFFGLLLLAGLETTVHLLGNTMITLSTRPEIFQRVQAQPALIPQLVEEVLRFEPSVHAVFRRAQTDVELSGTTIPKGATVYVIMAAAGRDPRQFPEPDRFQIEREKSGNLPFGYGIHFCLGAALARMEARLGLEALFSKVSSLRRLDTNPIEWNHAIHVRGPVRLPLAFTAA